MKTAITTVLIFLCASVFADDSNTVTLYTGEFPPFVEEKEARLGVSSALISEIFKVVNLQVKIEFLPWPRAMVSAKSKDGSGSYPWAKNEEREKEFYYSNPLHEDRIVYFGSVKDDKLIPESSICYPHDWDTSQFKKQLEESKMKITARPDTLDQCFLMLKARRVKYTFVNETVGKTIINKLKLSDSIKEFPGSSAEDYVYFIAAKNNPKSEKLIAAFNRGLAIIKKNGTYKSVLKSFGITD